MSHYEVKAVDHSQRLKDKIILIKEYYIMFLFGIERAKKKISPTDESHHYKWVVPHSIFHLLDIVWQQKQVNRSPRHMRNKVCWDMLFDLQQRIRFLEEEDGRNP